MQPNKIILGSAAFIIAGVFSLALKVSKKSGHLHIFGLTNTNNAACTVVTCVTGGTECPIVCFTQTHKVVEIPKNPCFYKTSTCHQAAQVQHFVN